MKAMLERDANDPGAPDTTAAREHARALWHREHMKAMQGLRDVASRMISMAEAVLERDADPAPLEQMYEEADLHMVALEFAYLGPKYRDKADAGSDLDPRD